MVKLFFIIGVFVGSLINLTDAPPDTEDKKDNEEIVFIKKEVVEK